MIKLYYTGLDLPEIDPNTYTTLLLDLASRLSYTLPVDFKFEFNVLLDKNLIEGDLSYVFKPFQNIRYSGNTDEIAGKISGELIDFSTTKLDYSINYPVEIEIQPSYDGTVNLILSDNHTPPRLINSRFSVTEGRRFYIVDREGNKDTNIYDDDKIDNQTRLYKTINRIPKLEFLGLDNDGKLNVGNYVFYFRLVDADGNETDIITESGIISCHIGNINDPKSIRGGMGNENSGKALTFRLTNLDSNYNFLNIYYSRSTSDYSEKEITTYYKIDTKFTIKSQSIDLKITGFEAISPITKESINVQYNIIDRNKTLAQAQNMLFLSNIHRTTIPYRELKDLSLRILPFPEQSMNIGALTPEYTPISEGKFAYFDSNNVYEYTGYWDEEMYRLAIVYIMKDYSLSDPYNIRGKDFSNNSVMTISPSNPYTNFYSEKPLYDGKGNRLYIEEEDNLLVGSKYKLENTKGVIKIGGMGITSQITNSETKPITIKVVVPIDVQTELKKYTKGFFLVRQKRIPTILCQGLSIGHDKMSGLPLLPEYSNDVKKLVHTVQGVHIYKPKYSSNYANTSYTSINAALKDTSFYRLPSKGESFFTFVNDSILKSASIENLNPGGALLVPDALLNSEYLSQMFSGSDFSLTSAKFKTISGGFQRYFSATDVPVNKTLEELDDLATHFVITDYTENLIPSSEKSKLILVPEDTTSISLDTSYYSTRAGEAEEAWRFSAFLKKELEIVETDVTLDGVTYKKESNDLIRGVFTPFIGALGTLKTSGGFYNIRTLGYSDNNVSDYFKVRYNDNSPFMAISDRYDWDRFDIDAVPQDTYKTLSLYRGDCFINQVSVRMLRNFQDPESPVNDIIVDVNTLENFKGYGVKLTDTLELNKESLEKINRGDVNAVRLGYWATFKFCSNINFAFRCVDPTYISEYALAGRPRSFHPLYSRSLSGTAKIADSGAMNVGYNSTTSDKYYYSVTDIPAIKNDFTNRVMYSQVHVTDAFKNGFRIFEGLNYRDYTIEFGAITKIISWFGNLIVVFEAGVGILPINERTLAGQSEGENVYLRNAGVLPEKPMMVSHGIGSAWSDSIQISKNYIYGVDAVAKKIWRTDGKKFEVVSDFRVQKFLNDNISFTIYDKTPLIGLRNVVTHYNIFKNDLMFTFYDQTFNEEEKAWSLCYNEQLNNWVTRFSWMPAFSENISNTFFTFARGTCKVTSMISKSIDTADGLGNIYINSIQENKLNTGDYLSLFYEKNLEDTLPVVTGTIVQGTVLSTPLSIVETTPILFSDGPSSNKHPMYSGTNYSSGYDKVWTFTPESGKLLTVYDKQNILLALSDNSKLYFYRSANSLNTITYGQDELIDIHVNGDVISNMQTTLAKPNLKINFVVAPVTLYSTPELNKVQADSIARDGWLFAIGCINSASASLDTQEYFLTLQGKELYKNPTFNYSFAGNASTTVYDNQYFEINKNTAIVDGKTVESSYIAINPQALYADTPDVKFTKLLNFFDRIYFAFLVNLNVILNPLGNQGTTGVSGSDKFQDSLYIRPSLETLTSLLTLFSNSLTCPPLRGTRGVLAPDIPLTETQRLALVSSLTKTIERYKANTTTNLWKHGQSGIFEHEGEFLPANWYGEQHPFEFEFVVNGDELGIHKMFDNLKIISNKVQPSSFEFQIVGDVYDFTSNNGEITKDPMFPYGDKYTLMNALQVEYVKTKEKRLLMHQPAINVDTVGLRKGNVYYKEDMWEVQIQPIKVKKVSSGKMTETKIRDKYCIVKIQYTGDQLAIITALQTLYTLSYS